MCLVFVDSLVQVLELKFRVFAITENRHRYKLLTNKFFFFMRSHTFLLFPVNSGGCGTCSLLRASVKLQKPVNVSCNSQYSILALITDTFV